MRTMIALSLLSALSLPALAQNDDINSVTIKSHPNKHYRMSPDEFERFVATYDLSNGMSISLYYKGFTMYAKLNNEFPDRLVATSLNTFESKDSALKIRIDLNDFGDASGEVQIPIVSSALAGNKATSYMVVALR